MRDQVTLQCRCGAIRGKLTGIQEVNPRRVTCLCEDCQAFAHYLGQAQTTLEPSGGTDILPFYPAHVTFTQGAENLKCLRLTRKGLIRWYAGCCKTPIANSPPNPKMPYVGIIHSIMNHQVDGTTADAALGPLSARMMGKAGIRPLPPGTHQKIPLGVMAMAVKLMARGWIKGKDRPSPFFDESTGRPRATPYVLTPEERESLRKVCGPR